MEPQLWDIIGFYQSSIQYFPQEVVVDVLYHFRVEV